MQSSFLSVLKTLLKPVTLQVSFVCKEQSLPAVLALITVYIHFILLPCCSFLWLLSVLIPINLNMSQTFALCLKLGLFYPYN